MMLLRGCFGGFDLQPDVAPPKPLSAKVPPISSPLRPSDDGFIRITYKPAPPRLPEPDFGFPAPTQPELSDLRATLTSALDTLQHATSHQDKIQVCIAMDNAARRLQAASDWLARADPYDVDSWLAVNKATHRAANSVRVLPAVNTLPRTDPPLSLYIPPPFNRVPSLGGRPSVNHAANFTSGDFGCWLPAVAARDSPQRHAATRSPKEATLPMPILRPIKCRTHASTSSSGGDTYSESSSMVEGNDAVMVTASPLIMAEAAAEAASMLGVRTNTPLRMVNTPKHAEGGTADCLDAALSGGMSSILYRTPETSPLPSPRMGPLYRVFSESTTVSPRLSPIHTTRW